jgi:hypothetical protein
MLFLNSTFLKVYIILQQNKREESSDAQKQQTILMFI